jgi:probable phosphoglycerate mutase
MTTVLLVRHALTDSTGKSLTGWERGVHLSDAGRKQAEGLIERLDHVRIDAVYSSPLERCVETATPLARARGMQIAKREGLGEVRYGEWTGRTLAQLSRTKLWKVVQNAPANVRFPGGESLLEVQARLVSVLREVCERHPKATVAMFSHADPIKLLMAHLSGSSVDMYQRWAIDTASVTVAVLSETTTRIVRVNDTGKLARPPARKRRAVRG